VKPLAPKQTLDRRPERVTILCHSLSALGIAADIAHFERVACHSGELFEVSIPQRLDPLGRDHDGRRSIHSALPNPANPAFRHPQIEVGACIIAMKESHDNLLMSRRGHAPFLRPVGEVGVCQRFDSRRVVRPKEVDEGRVL
jgi:hypothetical protein